MYGVVQFFSFSGIKISTILNDDKVTDNVMEVGQILFPPLDCMQAFKFKVD